MVVGEGEEGDRARGEEALVGCGVFCIARGELQRCYNAVPIVVPPPRWYTAKVPYRTVKAISAN